MSELSSSRLAEIHWEGDSREVLSGFPEEVRGSLGFALYELQLGRNPALPTRRMTSVGAGVFELKEGDARTWYRVIYLSKIGSVIHVLHCFEKKGRKTDRRDIQLARQRLARVRLRITEQKKHEKRT